MKIQVNMCRERLFHLELRFQEKSLSIFAEYSANADEMNHRGKIRNH